MKQLITTKFFRLLESKKNAHVSVWMKAYNDFATELFAENTTATDRTAYHNMLVYISVELAGLTDISEKNAVKYLQKAIDIVDRQMEFVRWQMQLETTAQKCPFTHLSPEHSKLKWTGNVVEWVELIYTLYSVNRINNGETSLKELFEQIGGIFDFEVKEFANYFMNIKNRVDGHRTKFMDLLKDAVLERMEDADRKSSRK